MAFNPSIFQDYLKEVERVLNSEPLLIYAQGPLNAQYSTGMFDQLLDSRAFTNALSNALNCAESGQYIEEMQCYTQQLQLSDYDLKTTDTRFEHIKLTQAEFEIALMATLCGKASVFGKLNSPYQKYLSDNQAQSLVKAILQQLNLLSEHWSFYWYNPAQFDLKTSLEDFYFWRLAGDCCLVFHDHQQHYFSLFTTGTD